MPLVLLASVVLLAAVLGPAVARPFGLPEAVVAVPAAVVAVATGLVGWDTAVAEVAELAPTVGFLAAVLALAVASLVGVEPVWPAARAGHRARGRGRQRRPALPRRVRPS